MLKKRLIKKIFRDKKCITLKNASSIKNKNRLIINFYFKTMYRMGHVTKLFFAILKEISI